MLSRLFGKDKMHEAAREVYRDIILQARRPVFYTDMNVPDTVEGRFDMITLHMSLVLRRLKAAGGASDREDGGKVQVFSQKLFDVMFRNMDDSLREMGVGDLKVGKKVRKLAEDFYGRLGAYEEAMGEADGQARETAMAAAVLRNVFGRSEEDAEAAAGAGAIAAYAMAADETLARQKIARLMLGYVSFPEPDAAGETPADTQGQDA